MRPLRLSASLASLLLVCACSHPKPEADEAGPGKDDAKAAPAPAPTPDPEAPPSEEPAADSDPAADADAVVEEVRLIPSELKVSDDGAKLEHCLDCKRQASTYNYCEFDKAAFEAAIGDADPDEKLALRVKMVRKSESNSVPDDPNAPQPHGGFTHIRHACSVDAVLPPG